MHQVIYWSCYCFHFLETSVLKTPILFPQSILAAFYVSHIVIILEISFIIILGIFVFFLQYWFVSSSLFFSPSFWWKTFSSVFLIKRSFWRKLSEILHIWGCLYYVLRLDGWVYRKLYAVSYSPLESEEIALFSSSFQFYCWKAQCHPLLSCLIFCLQFVCYSIWSI